MRTLEQLVCWTIFAAAVVYVYGSLTLVLL